MEVVLKILESKRNLERIGNIEKPDSSISEDNTDQNTDFINDEIAA